MSSEPGPVFPFPVFATRIPAPKGRPIFESFDGPGAGKAALPAGAPQAGDATLAPGMQQHIEEIGKEAYEKAFVLGEKAGRELGEAAVVSMVEKLSGLLKEISSIRSSLQHETERELVELAFQIARAIVGSEIETRTEIVLESARRAVQRIGAEGRITLRVHPSDANHIWKQREALSPYLSGKADISVEPDETIERGGCLAVTDFSEADATISGQFEVLRERLRQAREERK